MTNLLGVDTAKINGSKNPILRRYIEDYQFIQGFKKKVGSIDGFSIHYGRPTSDCGRSLLLWFIWSVGLMGLFSWVYYHHRTDWFNQVDLNWLNVWYLSLTKFMSLDLETQLLNLIIPPRRFG